MLKLTYFNSLVLFIITFFISSCTPFSCIHDQIVDMVKQPKLLTRSVKYQDIREQRDKNRADFVPLQVHFYIDNFDTTMSSNVIHNIELALRRAKEYIAKTFQVHKRKQPFVLERQSCIRKWQSGPNKGKCSKLSNEPEVCVTQEITYPIPDRFLDKMETYDFDSEKPRFEAASGTGLLYSNFIAFITSETSSVCEGSDVSAFGTYCRLDKDTNEPVAGILNFCPSYFTRKIYPFQHYYNIVLHEMFHILGFSIHLFEKFLPCKKGIYCGVPKNVIQTDSFGVPRLMFPLVIENMQKHFSCKNSDFGGPMILEVTNSTEEEEDETKQLSSHWDPILMYSSVMMPQFSEYDHIFVDNVTLSVFGSTGWYIVNYSQADNFPFGKDQGCEFGLNSTCDDNTFLCDPKAEGKLGCDLLRKSVGKCTELSPQRECGIYQPYSEESCDLKMGQQYGLDLYALGYQHKCFITAESENNMIPSCVPVKCKSNTTYDILINMTWFECFSQEMANMKNLSVFCPDISLFCADSNETTVLPQFCPKQDNFFIAVRMYFERPSFHDLYKNQGFKNFKVVMMKGMAEKIGVPVNYIVNSSLSVFKNIQLDFAICPTFLKSEKHLYETIHKVQNFLDSKSFMQISGESNIISSVNIQLDPLDSISFSDHEGFRTLLIFPVICAIFLVATIVASVMRWILFRKR